MKKRDFALDRHPKFGERREDLDPNQRGLLKITEKYLEKKQLGDSFEKRVCEMLEAEFPDDIIIKDIYFESGNYIESLRLYESLQIDAIIVTSIGVICIEAKWISNTKYAKVTGNAMSNSWTLKTRNGTSNSEINGLKQNFRHMLFLRELFSRENVECPVYQMTVIGGLERNKILVQQFIDGNLVDIDEMVDRINYIKKRGKHLAVDKNQIANILREWECNMPGKEKLHIVYVRNIANKRLPARCKKIMRSV